MGCYAAYRKLSHRRKQGSTVVHLIPIKDDLYMIQGQGGNIAMYVTGAGVILVDDQYEQNIPNILAMVKSVTDQPIKYVVNTHFHGDHTRGNQVLLPKVEIISHANTRVNMKTGKLPGLPRIVFTDETDVFLGGKQVRALYFGRGHTNGDAVVYFPALRVLHTGDLMEGGTPFIDYGGGGSVVEWIETLDKAMTLDFDTVIPGHGSISTKAGLLAYRNGIEKLRDRVVGMLREGKTDGDVQKVMTKEFGWLPDSPQMALSFPGMLKELKQLPLGSRTSN